MTSKIKSILTGTLIFSVLALGFMPAAAGAAEIQRAACQGSKLTFEGTQGDPTNPKDDACKFNEAGEQGPGKINDLITDIVNIFSVIVGIVAVIMIIYGGFRYITSGGDSSKVADAKNTIIYAIVGLVIVVFAQFIVKFILSRITQSGNAAS